MFKPIEKDELVKGVPDTRNWGGIVISLLVIIIICSLIIITALIVSPRVLLATKYEFEDMFNETFLGRSFDVQWMNDNSYARRDDDRNIMLYDVTSYDTPRLLLHRRDWDDNDVSMFSVSPDLKYILLACRRKSLYRMSSTAIYKVYQIETAQIVGTLNPSDVRDPAAETYLRYAGWAPKRSRLIFVHDNDIYLKNDISSKKSIRLTNTGVKDVMFNGVPDWVYEEDILHSDSAIYWSEDGNRLVFATFDDTGVNATWIPRYTYDTYPQLTYIRYPLPSYPVPTVQLHIVNLGSLTSLIHVTPPEKIVAKKEYFYKYIVWVNIYQFAVTWLNRAQNYTVVTLCNAENGTCDEVIHEQEESDGWVVLRGPPVFAESGNKFATILPLSIDKDEHYYHVFVLSTQIKEHKAPYTEGPFEVAKIVAFKGEDTVYFLANKNTTWDRHLYSVQPEVNQFETTCISCGVHENCTYFDAKFLPHSDKYLLFCNGWTVPRVTLHTIGKTDFTVLEDNKNMADAVFGREYINQTFEMIEMNGKKIPVRLFESDKIDRNRDHPLLLSVYGGPESQTVTSQFYQGWYTYLASKLHFVIVEIDGRGTAYMGQKHMMSVYKKLGQYEVEDQVDIISYLKNTNATDQRPFSSTRIDKNKVAVFGWSYGGFLSSLVHARSDVFNCSIAVAPVTDWRFYSAVYTERYMGLPTATENPQGYQVANVSAEAINFKNSSFLLVHGMADTNVHFQNSANLVSALLKADVDHRTMFYPEQNHFLNDPHIKTNLYKKMTDFLRECLQIVDDDD